MEPLINLPLVAATAATFAIAVLYMPRDRLFIHLGRLMSEPLGHAVVTAGLVLLGVFLARNINHLQV